MHAYIAMVMTLTNVCGSSLVRIVHNSICRYHRIYIIDLIFMYTPGAQPSGCMCTSCTVYCAHIRFVYTGSYINLYIGIDKCLVRILYNIGGTLLSMRCALAAYCTKYNLCLCTLLLSGDFIDAPVADTKHIF